MLRGLILTNIIIFFSTGFCISQVEESNISDLIGFDGEPYLAVNPTNPDNLIAG
jgi:hypothetical protein